MMRIALCVLLLAGAVHAAPFVIEVVDDQTGRGVPLVEVRTTSNIAYYTDSAGLVAYDEPGMMDQKVYFTFASFGYEFPKDAFGIRGTALDVKPGGSATVKIKRVNIAERLYRMTGEGIYRDTILAGRKAPIDKPLLNAQVTGQDSVVTALYGGKIYYFWGDTGKVSYALGNFSTTGATAEFPGKGGLDPSVGVNLNYFTAESGFTRPMVPLKEEGAIWISGVMVLKDDVGKERMLTSFSRMKDLGNRLERSFAVYNDEKEIFERLKPIPMDATLAPGAAPFKVSVSGEEYFYFTHPYPSVRVKADWKSATDLSAYEGYTCLKAATKYEKEKSELERDAAGKPLFAWRKNTPPMEPKQIEELEKAGKLKRDDTPFRLFDIESKKPIQLHGCSVYFNDYRKKYIMIGLQIMGDSLLGEVYFAESAAPEGPWAAAKKIVTHHGESGTIFGNKAQNMDFYNPTQHPFYDQEGGRIIYFEGTYTHMFSGNPMQTPRYEYNQMMYRLDLSDPRLKL